MFVRALLPPGEKARDSFFSLPLSPPFPLRSLSRAPFHLRFSRGINRLSAAAAARKTFFPMHIIKKKTAVSLECRRSLYFLSADWKSRLISLETNIVTALIYLPDNKYLTGTWELKASRSERAAVSFAFS